MKDKRVMPKYLENLALPNPELVMYYDNLQSRCIWIDEEIDELSLEYIKLIIKWNMEDKNKPIAERTPIRLIIFSPGGSLYVSQALTDIIEISETPVYGYNMGMAFSAGCFIFLSCHKRFSLKTSSFLLHKGSAAMEGNSGEIDSWKKEYDRRLAALVDFVCEKTKENPQKIKNKILTDWYISAEEAKEMGIVDEIIDDISRMWRV